MQALLCSVGCMSLVSEPSMHSIFSCSATFALTLEGGQCSVLWELVGLA